MNLQPGLEAIRYDQFFQKKGVRTAQHLIKAKFTKISNFELPRNSILHYTAESSLSLGIEPTDLLIRKSAGIVTSMNIMTLATNHGSPIPKHIPHAELETKYRKQHRTIRPMRNLNTVTRDGNNIVVVNYSMLPYLYKYRDTFQKRLYEFENHLATMINQINELAEQTQHHQFLQVKLPTQLPSKQLFIRGSNERLNRVTLPMWPDDESLFLLELWKWLGTGRPNSALGQLTAKALKSLNLIVVESGMVTVVNMGLLNDWRATPVTELGLQDGETPDRQIVSGLSPAQMQLNFLKFLTSAFTVRSVASKTVITTVTEETEEGDEIETVTDASIQGEDLDDPEDLAFLEDDDTNVDLDYDESGEIISESKMDEEIYVPNLDESEDVEPPTDGPIEYLGAVTAASNDLLESGIITVAEHNRYERLAKKVADIPNPWGEGSLVDFASTPPKVLTDPVKETQLKDKKTIFDKSLAKSSLLDFDRDYIEHVMQYDLARVILGLQKQGVIVRDVKRSELKDVNNEHEHFAITVLPVGGAQTTLSFKIPKVRPSGEYLSGGVKYRLRKQRGDLPIRKVSPTRVALTSYASKIMVDRSTRKVNNYGEWLHREIAKLVNAEDSTIKVLGYGNNFNHYVATPRAFSILAGRYKGLEFGPYKLDFNLDSLRTTYGADLDAALEQREVIVGTRGKDVLTMSFSGVISIEAKGEVLGTIEDLLDISIEKRPVEQVDVNIYGQRIPVALVLAYDIGFSNLLRTLKAKYRQVLKGQRMDLEDGEFIVKFADQTLIFEPDQKEVELIINSLHSFRKSVVNYDLEEFDNPDIWGTLLENEGLGVRYVREVDNLHTAFIDPITLDLLKEYGFPETFQGLVRESVRMLMVDAHPDEMDGNYMRIKGYERIPGLVYGHFMKSVRSYKARPLTAKSSLELHPYAVWNDLQVDPSKTITEESNPIHQLKETENVTYSGTGGRSSRTMVRRTRAFNPSDMGMISEATVDSADVGVTIYTSPNPKFAGLRGTAKPGVDLENRSSLLSTSALLCPLADRDDPKRINFISIQMSHVVACKGYGSFPVRTGYEQCIGQRTGSLFTVRARGVGQVTKAKSNLLVIEYEDEDLADDHIELGRTYGTVPGKTIPHDIVSDLKVGDSVDRQDVVAWNSGFFERDYFNPTDVVWLSGIPVTVALLDGHETIEDSCQVSERVVDLLEMPKTGLRELEFTADQTVTDLVNLGDTVSSESILCIVEDSSTAGLDLFDDTTRDTLSVMARNSPRSQYDGTVGRIEVIYNADFDDMSPSMRELVETADRARGLRAKRLKSDDVRTGYASDLPVDTIRIKIYIDSTNSAADGDKGVVGHQLKTVIGNVMHGVNETESGIPIDVKFGYLSVEDRMTVGIITAGTTSVLMRLASRRAAAAFRAKL